MESKVRFKKSDLRTGMIVKDRWGYLGFVLLNTSKEDGIKWFVDSDDGDTFNGYTKLNNYNEDLTIIAEDDDEDIVAVYDMVDKEDLVSFDTYDLIVKNEEKYKIWEESYNEISYDEINEIDNNGLEDDFIEVTLKDIENIYGKKVKIVIES